LRLGHRGTTVAVLTITLLSISGTHQGLGPFFQVNNWESIMLLQLFIATAATLSLLLTALLSERQHSQYLLERKNVELERFAHLASHDLQEPLRTVNTFTHLLERRFEIYFDRDGIEYLSFVRNAATRMYYLINALLDYSRLGRSLNLASVDGTQLVVDAISNLKTAIEESKASIIHEKLPRVAVDRGLLTSVFQNLIANSIKFRGREPLTIRISAQEEFSRVLFTVSDNGLGINSKDLAKIFELFQRASPDPDRKFNGVGLGLAACKRIIEAHCGNIWAESPAAGGAIFSFSLPRSR
jgi:light-regulated signal transduction histidine kinase (bacteriophytochrome)